MRGKRLAAGRMVAGLMAWTATARAQDADTFRLNLTDDAPVKNLLDDGKVADTIQAWRGGFRGGWGGGFRGGFGGGGGLDEVKKQLGASDEEWKVIRPKLEKVLAARRALTEPRGMSFGFGGFGGGPGPAADSTLTQAQTDLKAVLDDPKHSAEEVR